MQRVLWLTALFGLLSAPLACRPKEVSAPEPSPRPVIVKTSADPLRIEFTDAPSVVAKPIGRLKRGINLGNGLDAPREGEWGVVLSEAHFDMAKAAGLDHVRLPVRFSAHASLTSPFAIDADFFERVDWAIEQALSRELSIIVDLHHYEELMTDPDAHTERLLGLWSQIAERYKDRPDSVLFELLNEPCQNLHPEKYNQLLARLIPLVRETNPTRTILVDSFFWASVSYLKDLKLPEDPEIAASFHMYHPILFTHQGASWMGPEYQTTGVLFPGPSGTLDLAPGSQSTPWVRDWLRYHQTQPAERNPSSPRSVAEEFDRATRYVEATGRRVYLGEFGAIDVADPVSRENYLRLIRLEAERRGFAWALWDDGGRNRAMNVQSGTWVPAVSRALFQDQPEEQKN